MQVKPIISKLKPPGTKRLRLKYEVLLSGFAFNFNLRRYSEEQCGELRMRGAVQVMVRRCRLTLSKPLLKAPMV
jgi:hypothetical protein